ncbi:MAG: hypothetical protein HKN13_08410 [Rhodothermales bacterium]|nr:hypothetical protein [Rhodothermales bacterium]
MSNSVYLDKDGFTGNAGITVSIAVDVDSVVCLNPAELGADGRTEVTAGSGFTVTADSGSESITIVIHPGDLTAKCVDGRGDTKGPGGP